MTTSLYELNGVWQQFVGGGVREFMVASAVILAVALGIVSRQRRARAARRLQAAARAYADREIASQTQLQNSGCPA